MRSTTQNARWKRNEYRTKPAARLKILARVKQRHESLRGNPVYMRLCAVRKTIVTRRDSIDRYPFQGLET